MNQTLDWLLCGNVLYASPNGSIMVMNTMNTSLIQWKPVQTNILKTSKMEENKTVETRLEEIEKILFNRTSYRLGSHKNITGITVYEYMILPGRGVTLYNVLKDNGYTSMKTDSQHYEEYFNRENLSSVSYCEGDVYIVLYIDEEEYQAEYQRTMEFIKQG